MELLSYQQKIIPSVRRAMAKNMGALMVMPTGSGKTVVSTHIAKLAHDKGKRVLVLVHSIELLYQMSEALLKWGVHHGRIESSSTIEPHHRVQVAMVATLAARLSKCSLRFDLCIIDEAHHVVPGTLYERVCLAVGNPKVLGVTATPCRIDNKPLGRKYGGMFDEMVLGPSVIDLIDMGRLVEPVIHAPPMPDELRQYVERNKNIAGDYKISALDELMGMSGSAILGDYVSHYRKVRDRSPAILFAPSVMSAENAANKFKASGYSSACLSGDTPSHIRKQMLSDLGNGKLNVLTSCGTVCEGTDVPAVETIILARPTKSLRLYIQQVGRGMRSSKGKNRFYVNDHVGLSNPEYGFGSPLEDWEWSLDVKPKIKGEAINECPACYAVFDKKMLQCPECGAMMIKPKEAPEPPIENKQLELNDGIELEVVDNGAQRARERRAKIERASSYDEFLALANEFGYKKAWARHRYDEYLSKMAHYQQLSETLR